MSELGSYLQGYEGYSPSAPAGTKRIGKLLGSVKWTVEFIDRYLLSKADARGEKAERAGETDSLPLGWKCLRKSRKRKTGRVMPSSLRAPPNAASGPNAASSSAWPAPRPVRVMGMQWTAALIAGMAGVPHLAVSRWWTTKGVFATKLRDAEEELLRITVRRMGSIARACL